MVEGQTDGEQLVIVIDDDGSLRDTLSNLFRSVGLRCETYRSPAEFLEDRPPDVPSCMVLDVRLPGLSGLDFQAELVKAEDAMPIVFMTGHGDIPMTVQAMKAGAIEFLTKPFRDQEMLDAVQAGLAQDRDRREGSAEVVRLKEVYGTLTARERDVMALVTDGLMNKQIASELEVSEITVKVHRGNVIKKMGAKSLAELVRMADLLQIRQVKD